MYQISSIHTVLPTFIAGFIGFCYGKFSEVSPLNAAAAFAISYFALNILSNRWQKVVNTSYLTDYDAWRSLIAVNAIWGIASIIAFRQLNLIAGIGTVILSGCLASRVYHLYDNPYAR